MAKAKMRPETRAAKMRDNRMSRLELPCSVKGCESDFYVGLDRKRHCLLHFNGKSKAPQKIDTMRVLGLLGLL